MEILKYCSVALLVSLLLLVIKQWKSDTVLLVRLAATLVFGYAALSAAAPLVNYLRTLMEMGNASAYTVILFKALGIAVLTHLSADLCRECGESAAANGVELIGRIELLLLSLPLIQEILTLAQELLNLGGGA